MLMEYSFRFDTINFGIVHCTYLGVSGYNSILSEDLSTLFVKHQFMGYPYTKCKRIPKRKQF